MHAANTLVCTGTSAQILGETVTCVATLAGTNGDNIFFLDGTQLIGSAPLSAGTAQFVTASLGAGVHSLTAEDSANTSVTATQSYTVQPRPTTTVLTLGPNTAIYGASVSAVMKVSDAGTQLSKLVSPKNFTTGRYGHTATLLADGNVLILGGWNGTTLQAGGETYNPATGNIAAPTNALPDPRVYHAAALMNNGKVLVVGGTKTGLAADADQFGEVLDPVAHTFSVTTSKPLARINPTATLLSDGRVLIAGGLDTAGKPTGAVEIYDPSAGTFTTQATGLSILPRYGHTATLLPDNTVLIAGGIDALGNAVQSEIYTPGTGAVATIADLPGALSGHSATLLPEGLVLIAGGTTTSGVSGAEYFYEPRTQVFYASSATILTARAWHTATLLNNANLLLLGGLSTTNTAITTSEIYVPKFNPIPRDATVTFGSTEPTDGFGVSCAVVLPLQNHGSTTCTGTVIAGHVGAGAHTIKATFLASAQFQTSNGTAPLTVTPKTLTVTASSGTKAYGGTFTTVAQYAGFVGSDTASNLATAPACVISGTASAVSGPTAPVSTYTTTCSGGVDTNYSFKYVNGTLKVTAKALTITASDVTKTYGDTVSLGTVTTGFTVVGLVTTNGDDVTTVDLSSTGAAPTAQVSGSPYAIVPSNATGTGLTNYAITYVSGHLTVNKKALTITALDQAKTYGDNLPLGRETTNFSTAGLINGDTVVSVILTSSGGPVNARVSGSPFAIVASSPLGTGLGNYAVTFVDGQLIVNPKPLTITPKNVTKVYGLPYTFVSAPPPIIVVGLVTANSDDVTSCTFSSLGTAPNASVASSPYSITSVCTGVGLDNYTISYGAGSLTVIADHITISILDETLPSGTGSTPGMVQFAVTLCPQATTCTNMGGGFPTGTLTLDDFDGTTHTTTPNLKGDASGKLTFSVDTTKLAAGSTHVYKLTYDDGGATANFAPSSDIAGGSKFRSVTIHASSNNTATVGQSVPSVSSVTVYAQKDEKNNPIADTVNFKCAVVSTSGAPTQFGCVATASNGSNTVTFSGDSATLNVAFTLPAKASTRRQTASLVPWVGVSGFTMFGLFFSFLGRKRTTRERIARLLLTAVTLGFLLSLGACGSSGFSNPLPTYQQGGSSSVAGSFEAVLYGTGTDGKSRVYAIVPIQVSQ